MSSSTLIKLIEDWDAKDSRWSDLHIKEGEPVRLRNGSTELVTISENPATLDDIKALLSGTLDNFEARLSEKPDGVDFSLVAGGVRFRVNLYYFSGRKHGLVMRRINGTILKMSEAGWPDSVFRMLSRGSGLLLVTGATGSGKSTTLASFLDHINENEAGNIVTLEDPVEFVFESKKCSVSQREVNAHSNTSDAATFAGALRASLRQDPDVIMVGEMRDGETARIALEAAQTGHLVMATLHTRSAASTMERLLNMFESEYRQIAQAILSESLVGIISQNLLPRIGGGRVLAREILINAPSIASQIRDGKSHQIANQIRQSKAEGMNILNAHLMELLEEGAISPESAMVATYDPRDLTELIEGWQKRGGLVNSAKSQPATPSGKLSAFGSAFGSPS